MLKQYLIRLIALVLGLVPVTALTEDLLIDDFAGGMSARAEAKLGENPKYRTLKWENMVPQLGAAPIGGSRHYSSLIFEGNSLTVATERVGRDWFLIHRADPQTRGASVLSWDGSNNASSRSARGLSEFIPALKHISHLILEDVTINIPAPTNEPVILKVSLYDVDDPKGNKALVATMLLTSSTAISRIPIATSEFKPEDSEAEPFSGNIAAITLTIDGGSVKGIYVRIGAMRLMGPELRLYITEKGIAAPADIATAGSSPEAGESRMTPVIPSDEADSSTVPASVSQEKETSPPAVVIETPSATATYSPAPAKTATSMPSPTVSPTVSPTISPSSTATATVAATLTIAPTATTTPSPTATATAAPTLTVSPTASFTATATETATLTATSTVARKIEAISAAPTPTKAAIPTATVAIPTPTATRTNTASATATRTSTSTATLTVTATSSPTKTPKLTPTPKIVAASPTPTITVTPQGTPFYGRCARNLDGKIVCVKFPGQGQSECSMTRDCDTPTPTPSPTITLTPMPSATPVQSCICACRAQTGNRELVCVEPWVFRVARLGFSCIDQERGSFPWSFERDAASVPVNRGATYCQDRWNGKEGAGYPDSSTRAPGVPCLLEQCREGVIRDDRR